MRRETIIGKFERVNIGQSPLRGVVPNNIIQLSHTLKRYGIEDNLRISHFLAQCSFDSTGFTNREKTKGPNNETSGENFKYRGRGFVKIVGKEEYRKFGESLDEDFLTDPSMTEEDAILCSAYVFHSKRLNDIADLGATLNIVKEIRTGLIGSESSSDQVFTKFQEIWGKLKTNKNDKSRLSRRNG